jgi:hypothetical protein
MDSDFVKIPRKSLVGTNGKCTITESQLKSFNNIEECKDYVLTNYRKGTGDPTKLPAVGFSVSKDKNGNVKCYVDDGNQSCPLFKDNYSDYYIPSKYPDNEYDRVVIRKASIIRYNIPEFDETKTCIKDIVAQHVVEGKIGSMNIEQANMNSECMFIVPRCDKSKENCKDTLIDDVKPAMLFSFGVNPKLNEPGGILSCLDSERNVETKRCMKSQEYEDRIKNVDIDILSRGTISRKKFQNFDEGETPFNLDIEYNEYTDIYFPFRRNLGDDSLEKLFSDLPPRVKGVGLTKHRGKKISMPNPRNKFIIEGEPVMCITLGMLIGNTRVTYSSGGINYLYTGTDYTLEDEPEGFVIEYDNPINRVENYEGDSSIHNFDKSSIISDINGVFYESRKEDSNDSTNSSSKKWIIISSVVAGILILGIIGYVIYRKRKNQE